MAKLVTKFKYLKPGKKKKGGYARYIATREGVEKIDDSQIHAPATEKQQQLIQKIIADNPEVMAMLEYEDYNAKPTVGNASELISRALEDVADSILNEKTYADYIATRPRAQRFGAHGLFTDEGKPVNLREVSRELNQHEGNVWTAIISLRREDAERLDYNSGERWRDLLRSHSHEFSEQLHIPMQNLRWFAAFHNESHHPHVHVIIYSTDASAGFLAKSNVNNLRSSLGKEIFAQDLACRYQEQTAHRDSLRSESKELVANIIAQINEGNFDNPVLESKLLELSKILSETGGKKVYGYLDADTKALVDDIVDKLADDERLSQLYELWYQDKDFIHSTYTDEPAERVPLSQNEEFKPIRNAVIREALNISEDRFTVEDEDEVAESDAEPTNIPLDESDEEELPQPRFSEFERLKKKAAAGNMYSQYTLAKLLLDRNSEHYEPETAVEWLKKSSDRGNAVAKYRLGKLFLLGEDVPQDTDEALRWLNNASDDGYEYAQYLLGKLYAEGKYVEKDVFFALLYLERAAMQNNPYAAYLAGKLYLYPCIEYACASGMSFLSVDTKGDVMRNYGNIAKEYGYHVSVVDLRNPTRSNGNNLLHLVNKYMDLYQANPDQLVYKAKCEKYAKIISKTIILAGMDASSFGQNAYFYDAAEGLLTATILLVAEFCEPSKRHIVSVFKIIQELLAPSPGKKGKNQFQQLMELLPNDHKAKWFAGAALNTAEQSMASVMSTALSRLNGFLDSELEQILCFDTELDAERFCNEKSAFFVVMPEENPNTFFMVSLIIQQLYREILAVADENGGKLNNRCVFYCDEFGTIPKIESAEMMFSAARSRRLQIVPIIQSFSQLDKNYGKEGAEIIVDNTQITLFGGFAPNSSSAETLSKALGSRTVMSGSISRGKDNPSQSLQMVERALMTPDELKAMPKVSSSS